MPCKPATCEIVEEVSSALMIPKKVAELRADVVIIDTESPSRDVLEQICVVTQDAPRPIVMVSEDTQPRQLRRQSRQVYRLMSLKTLISTV